MTRLGLVTILLGTLVMGGRCAGSRLPDERPRTLRQVNEQLDGRWARIQQTNGRLIERVEDVEVGRDTTRFYDRMEQAERGISTRRVRAVQVRARSRSRRGFIAGAIPGLALAAKGVRGLLDSSDEGWDVLFAMTIGGGLMIAAIGGALVGTVASAIGNDQWITVYERPVDDYRRKSQREGRIPSSSAQ